MIVPFPTLLVETYSHRKLAFTGSMTGIQGHTNKAITDFCDFKTGNRELEIIYLLVFTSFQISHKAIK